LTVADTPATELENELIQIFLSALKKGMTAEEFFGMADITLEHLRGGAQNETLGKIIDNTATTDEVRRMIGSLTRKRPD